MICDFCLTEISPNVDRVEKSPSETHLKRFAKFHLGCWVKFDHGNEVARKQALSTKGKKKRV